VKTTPTILLLSALALACADEDNIPWSAPADLAPDLIPDSRPQKCGDDIVEGKEKCDGKNLDGQTCTTLNYYAGTLTCSNACTFDFSDCTNCGNGKKDKDENCEGTDLGGHTCKTLGYKSGTLTCKHCHLVVKGCKK